MPTSPTALPVLPPFAIDRSAAAPLHRQVYLGFRDAILDRRLRPGDRIPSTRALVAQLGVSRLPVLSAFSQLVAEGYVESRIGTGTFVTAELPAPVRAVRRPPPVPPRRLPRFKAPPLDPAWLREGGAFSLSGVAVEHFPHRAWARFLSRQARRMDRTMVRYGDHSGFGGFRAAIARHLRASRGVQCDADQVVVTSGSQQALVLAAQVLLEPGDAVVIEDPGYWGAREAFLAGGATLMPVRVDGEGVVISAAARRARSAPRAAFVTPSHQFPLGTPLSARRRLELLDWAAREEAWIIEDDYNGEYRYGAQPIPALQGMDRSGRVIYVGTLSKTLVPSLRIGYLVPPPDLVPLFIRARRVADISPPTVIQAALADLIDEGHFARHLRRTRDLCRERRRVLVESLIAAFGDSIEITGDHAGLHVTILFPDPLDDVAIARRAGESQIRVVPLSTLCLEQRLRGLVLGYGGTSRSEIAAGVARLAMLVAAERGGSRPGMYPLTL